MPNVHILLIDDHAMFRAGLRMLLGSSISVVTVLESGSLNEAIRDVSSPPDLVLLDIKLPGINGVDGLALLKRQWPEVPVLMLSSQDEPEMVRLAMARGATGFLSKAETAERMVAVVRQLLRHDLPAELPDSCEVPPARRFTPRQCEVLELLCQGLSNKLIARRLGLAENTVRWHVQAILSELQVSSRSEAAFAARTLGLIG
jgi:DNA-binding NarL/FixJ family response regulator